MGISSTETTLPVEQPVWEFENCPYHAVGHLDMSGDRPTTGLFLLVIFNQYKKHLSFELLHESLAQS